MRRKFQGLLSYYQILNNHAFEWSFAGGWAIDLFLGYNSREHSDIDIALFREDQFKLRRQLKDWHWEKIQEGKIVDWHVDDYLELSVHQIHARKGSQKIKCHLNEKASDQWIYRRQPDVLYPIKKLFRHNLIGLPYLAPEIVLLHKTTNRSVKDDHDFLNVYPKLDPPSRQWLEEAISQSEWEGHPWLSKKVWSEREMPFV